MILLKSTQTRILNHNQEMVMARIVIRKGNGQGIWIEMQFWKDVSWDFFYELKNWRSVMSVSTIWVYYALEQ